MAEYALSWLISFACGLLVVGLAGIPLLRKLKFGQEILSYVVEHDSKKGTPTMGGVFFVAVATVVCLFFFDGNAQLAQMCLVVTVAYCLVGALDDFIKIRFKHNLGLKAYQKIIVQLAISVIVAIYVYNSEYVGNEIVIPFSMTKCQLGWWIIPLVIFIYLACTNGVNLTDGLDGLATSTTIVYLIGIGALLYLEKAQVENGGETLLAQEYGNILVLIAVFVGVLCAFLVFNCFPAKIFMGDAGSMALGAVVACVSIFSKMSLFIPILGVCYVISCLSVIAQVSYFKLTHGKRILLMAPFHHHLQHKGLSETLISVIYCCITACAGALLVLFATL